ncbi:MAG: S-layer homology domain-containing protein [Clostridiales Family XIII bacterium]|jgi:hypothetical protein|nr:S-layer homology domain-containing protein [Clostridiales Family XIII bacterium]
MTERKATAVLVVFVMLAGLLFSGFSRQSGIGNVYYAARMEIFDGVSFTRILAGHDTNGVERAYVVEADTVGSQIRPIVFSGEAGDKYVLDAMTATLEAQGWKVVAGVNGDLFSTDTACPRGLTIHDGIVQSSGYDPQFVIAFDGAGRAELAWTDMNYSLSTDIFVPQPDGTHLQTPFSANIGFVNVPHGGAKALHLYSRLYGASTKTSGENIEVVLDAGSADAAQLRMGQAVRATVSEVRYGGGNAPIGDTQLVLSTAADSATAQSLGMMAVGMPVDIHITDLSNGPVSRSVECIGTYTPVYDNGRWISTGSKADPRTLLGIKRDGSIMLYVLDGRQPGISGGIGLSDAASHMVELGCSVVVNLDGGGSSTIAVREPGIDSTAVMKNSPSDGSQRRVANGLFLAYRSGQSSGGRQLSAYPDSYLAMPGASVQISTYMSNGLYERSGYGALSGLDYRILEGGGSVDRSGLFTAGDSDGRTLIEISDGDASATAEIDVYSGVTISPSQNAVFADPGQSLDLGVTAAYGHAPIAHSDSLFAWECDEGVGRIDGNGLFTATERSGVSGEIRVSFGQSSVSIPVQVGAKISFIDMLDPATGTDHWARPYIEALAGKGIVNGIGDSMFGPDYPLTRAQFLAMLAKTVEGLDLNAAPPSGFQDVPVDEWHFRYVNWGHAAGIVNGMDATSFAPDAEISREQMAVMLDSFASKSGIYLPASATPAAFADSSMISSWAALAADRVVGAGIMNGMPDGGFEPQGSATRAQAAKVAFVLCAIRDAGQASQGVSVPPVEGAPQEDGAQGQDAPPGGAQGP